MPCESMNRLPRLKKLLAVALVALCATGPACSQTGGDFQRCVDTLRAELPQHPEVRRDTFDAQTSTAQDLRPTVETATRSQPEFTKKIWDYVATLADAQRAEDGKQVLQREAASLPGIMQRYKVDAATMVAVFGVETDYGRIAGRYPVVDATLGRACAGMDSKERRGQFFAALWLVQEGLVRVPDFRGSWAGAFGMTQFMPGTFIRYKADGDGDGQIDIYRSVPDALATTANYLSSLGWSDRLPWGVEVKVPAAVTSSNALEKDHACLAGGDAMGKCRSVAQWAAAGVTRVDGGALLGPATDGKRFDEGTRAALLMPAGSPGPAWLVTRNYDAVWRYNRADAYALAIGLLADALRGDAAQQTRWPTDDPGLSRAEFRELQALLVMRGHADVVADGFDGPRTQDAIRAEEGGHALPETGRPGVRILGLLRAEPASAKPAP